MVKKKTFFLITCLSVILFVFYSNSFFQPKLFSNFYDSISDFDSEWVEDENDRICQWISIDRDYFFKRTSTIFFNDANLLTFTYFAKSKASLHLLFIFNIYLTNDQVITKKISNITRSMGRKKNFGMSYVFYRFDNQTYLNIKDNIQKFEIKIKDLSTKKATKEMIQVKVRNIFLKDKKGVFLCSKCMYNTKIEDFDSVKWWIDMKKKIGYTKISFCNNSIENHQKYTQLFDSYKDFVELEQFNCLPNLFDNSTKYFLSYSEFSKLDNGLAYHIFDSVFIFFMNECYWSNIDKYKYVSVMDRDEIVFPRNLKLKTNSEIRDFITRSTDFTKDSVFNGLECQYEENNMEKYLDKLAVQIGKKENSSFYFKNGIKFPNELYLQLFDSIELYFNQSSRNRDEKHRIEAVYDKKSNKKFLITISNPNEFDYALKLLQLHHKVMKPYFEENKERLLINKYNSFYTVVGSSVYWVFGKTIHNTNRSLATEIHFNTKQIDSFTLKIINGRDVAAVNDNLGHLSHFKKDLRMKPIPISQIIPDLNYINCYYRPTINKS